MSASLATTTLEAAHVPAIRTRVLRRYAESKVAEVMQKVMVVLWQTCGHVADFRPWALGVPRLAALRLMGAD